jgi:hypothetical protein
MCNAKRAGKSDAKPYGELSTVDRKHSDALGATTADESCLPCGRVLREGAQGEAEWVARLWVR